MCGGVAVCAQKAFAGVSVMALQTLLSRRMHTSLLRERDAKFSPEVLRAVCEDDSAALPPEVVWGGRPLLMSLLAPGLLVTPEDASSSLLQAGLITPPCRSGA